ncbi:hypothetical protein CspeluHIS016_0113550 [Cutaneotrichosporon spelunceum]|uniref:Galactose mutarotase-like protein n=1 Tax=Cutaneotrichosporon spelunceum TaxID=1672016 RepID=A0AAD3TQH0_9TREE|nr:hypothetical protein CspeluHIS016_0113550 [Cutaneotrichosporon spelunceum]
MTKHIPLVSPAAVKEYTLSADGITATFIPFGARLKSLRVPDANGLWRQVTLGFANIQSYANEAVVYYYGAVIGRYANRIRKGTFTIDGVTTSVTDNESGNTLHGGKVGYDSREWTVVALTTTAITFSLMDYGFEGFPGTVLAIAQYTVSEGKLTAVLSGYALDQPTPIMLTTHAYFNLGSDTTVMEDTLRVSASRVIGVDSAAAATGEVVYLGAKNGYHLNFTTPKKVKMSAPNGLDNCFIFDDRRELEWTSASTGIRMRLRTNQPAVQLYSCAACGDRTTTQLGKLERFGAMAVEPQGWIDGINHPEWNQNQVYRPGSAPFVNVAEYSFDTVPI